MKFWLAILGLLLIAGAVVLGVWLSIYILLYGGIMQAVENWGVNNSAVVWGIIKAALYELGIVPAYIVGKFGFLLLARSYKIS